MPVTDGTVAVALVSSPLLTVTVIVVFLSTEEPASLSCDIIFPDSTVDDALYTAL